MIKKFFLTAPAWALCLMMVVPYAVYKFTAFGHQPLDWAFLLMYFLFVALGWVYSVGRESNQRLASDLQMPGWYLNVAIVIPFIYVPAFLVLVIMPLQAGDPTPPPKWMIYFHFASIIAAAFLFWFAARQFTALRNKEAVSFIDYYPAFMAFWFGFIGVWFMQPKITKAMANSVRSDVN